MTRRDAILRKKVFNVAVPAMPLFHAFGRVGCFLTGCCYGKELSNSWQSSISFEALKLKLKQYVVGWVNYFKLANMKTLLQRTDEWLRRRLRMFIWKRWKRTKTRYRRLKQLGYNHSNAIKYANTRKGYWHVAGSQILCCSITDDRLRKQGYQFFSDYYKTVCV